jgi:integrase
MARRGHGEGSIYQRKTDGRWVASITLEDRRRKVFYGKTRNEVQEKLKIALYEQKQGTLATGPQQTLKVYLDQWLEQVHRPAVRIASYISYRTILDKHIIPALGNIQLQKLTPQRVQAFYARKLEEGLSPSTVQGFHAVLHKALDNAVRWNLLARNVCDAVSLPRKVRHEIQPLTQEQVQQLLKAAQEHELEALLTVALVTGMRKGELLGLRWQDINLETGSLQVSRTVNRYGRYGMVESEPKSAKGRRNILLPLFVIEMLRQHYIRQQERREDLGTRWKESGLVFCNGHGGYFSPAQLHKRMRGCRSFVFTISGIVRPQFYWVWECIRRLYKSF